MKAKFISPPLWPSVPQWLMWEDFPIPYSPDLLLLPKLATPPSFSSYILSESLLAIVRAPIKNPIKILAHPINTYLIFVNTSMRNRNITCPTVFIRAKIRLRYRKVYCKLLLCQSYQSSIWKNADCLFSWFLLPNTTVGSIANMLIRLKYSVSVCTSALSHNYFI